MPWGQIGAVLVVLLVIFVAGRLWFYMVEGMLGGLKRLFSRKKEPPAWHTLPAEQESGQGKEEKQNV